MKSDVKCAAANTADLKQGANEMASDLGGQAQGYKAQAADAASDLYGRAKDTARSASDALPDSVGDAASAGRRAYEGGAEQLARQVTKQPFEALLLAGAIGYLVGWATSRS